MKFCKKIQLVFFIVCMITIFVGCEKLKDSDNDKKNKSNSDVKNISSETSKEEKIYKMGDELIIKKNKEDGFKELMDYVFKGEFEN